MRKGIHATYAVMGFALLAIVLVLCGSLLLVLKDVYNKTEDDLRCATQVRSHAAVVKFTSDMKAPDVICPTERLFLTLNDDPKEALATEMKRCWDTWGRGELQLFGDDQLVFCHVCSMVYVPGAQVEGFPAYLDTTTAPKAEGLSFADYLAGKTSGEHFSEENTPGASTAVLSTEEPVGVIFYYAKGQDAIDAFYNGLIGTPVRGATQGVIVGGAAASLLIISGVASGGLTIAAAAVVGVAGGGLTGMALSLFGREDLDYMSAVLVRPLSEEDIKRLNCQYAPIANS